jgi:hypothetical protein
MRRTNSIEQIGKRRGKLKSAFQLCVVAASFLLFGCASQMAQDSLKSQCAKDGKQPFLIAIKQNGIPLLIDSATATGVCLESSNIGHLPSSFGADIVLIRVSGQSGVGLFSVKPGSAAANGGLQASDFVTEFRGRPIARPDDLQSAIETTPAGEHAGIKYRRGESVMSGTVQF